MIMHRIEEELGRPVYGMADFFFRTVPWVGTLWSRTGGVPAHPDNAVRLRVTRASSPWCSLKVRRARPRATRTGTS